MRMPGPGPWKRTARVMCTPGRGTGRSILAGAARICDDCAHDSNARSRNHAGRRLQPRDHRRRPLPLRLRPGPAGRRQLRRRPRSRTRRASRSRTSGASSPSAGAGFGDVVRCGVFLADINDFAAMNGVYAHVLPRPQAGAHDRPGRRAAGRHQGRDRLRGRPALSAAGSARGGRSGAASLDADRLAGGGIEGVHRAVVDRERDRLAGLDRRGGRDARRERASARPRRG